MNKFILAGAMISLAAMGISCSPKPSTPEQPIVATPEAIGMPDITLIREEGTSFSSTTLPGNTILIFFGADCDHCQREAQQVHDHLKSFELYTVYFVSMDPFSRINKFAETYSLHHQPNIHFARADEASVYQAMGYMQTPTICIFNQDKKLVKRFDGETAVSEILKLL